MDRKEAIRRSVRKELYALARRWGSKAVLVTQDEGTFDEKTGANVATIARQNLDFLVTWERMDLEKFAYDLAFVAANKNFTYGGFYEVGDRFAIITYLDGEIDLDHHDFIIYEGVRYNVHKKLQIDNGLGWMLHLRETKGQLPGQVIEKDVLHWLEIQETIS